jgi:hypothetical protein
LVSLTLQEPLLLKENGWAYNVAGVVSSVVPDIGQLNSGLPFKVAS